MSEPAAPWRRLDMRMLVIHPVVELVRSLPAIAGLFLAGQGSGHGSRWSLIATAVVAAAATLRWFTTQYRITPTQIQLRNGLFRRRTVAAPLDRVRTVDVTAHPQHRALGLVRVIIGTGTSDRKGRPTLTLDGLRVTDAARLRAELLHRAPVTPATTVSSTTAASTTAPPTVDDETELLRLPLSWLRYAPFTLSGALTAVALAGFAWRLVSEAHIDPARFGPLRATFDHLRRAPVWRDAVEIGAGVVAFIALASTAGYLLAFWNFRLTRHRGGTLHITRGLITSRATSVEERRLRGAEISEPLLLRTVGGARTLAITTGLRVGRGAERGGTILMPPGPRSEAARVAAAAIGLAAPFTVPLVPHGPAARRRRYVRAVTGTLVLVCVIAAGWALGGLPGWGWPAGFTLVALSVPLAADRARNLGHALCDGYLVTCRGSLVRRRVVLSREGIIGVNMRRSFFQRRAGLATLTATTAAGRQGYRVQDLAEPDATGLADAVLPGLLDGLRLSLAASPDCETPGRTSLAKRR